MEARHAKMFRLGLGHRSWEQAGVHCLVVGELRLSSIVSRWPHRHQGLLKSLERKAKLPACERPLKNAAQAKRRA
jgi:hypothetical protein